MPLKIALGDEPGEHILVKQRHGAGVEAKLFAVARHQRLRQHHVAHTHGRRKRMRERVDVDHAAAPVHGIERLQGLFVLGKFRVEIVLDQNRVPPGGPGEIFAALGSGGRDAGREAVERRDMQDGRVCALQRVRADAVVRHRQQLADCAVGRVDLPDLLIARILQPVDPVPPQQLHDEPVEILRAGADHDAFRLGEHPAVAQQIFRDRVSQLRAAVVRRLFQQPRAAVGDDLAHELRQRGIAEAVAGSLLRGRVVRGQHPQPRLRRRAGRQAGDGADIIAAARLCRQIPLVHQLLIRAGDCGDAHMQMLGQRPLGRQLLPGQKLGPEDILPDAGVEPVIFRLSAAGQVVGQHRLTTCFRPSRRSRRSRARAGPSRRRA